MELNNALRAASSRYENDARRDIQQALSSFKDLHPKSDSFSGRTVVALDGTIPVMYKGTTYNIPVCLYLLDTHPYHPPVCFVRPTADMMIKPSQHVDNQGRIYLPYLSEWKYPQCSLEALLQVIAMVFQDNCPVFARSSASAQSNTTSSTTPYPNDPRGGYLPYPSGGAAMPMPGVGGGGYGGYGSSQSPPYPSSSSTTSPPYPPPRPPPTYQTSNSNASTNSNSAGQTGTLGPETIRLSLISAIEDKTKRRLRDTYGTTFAEVRCIRETNEQLQSGQRKLTEMLSKLEAEQQKLDSACIAYSVRCQSDLIDKNAEMTKILENTKPTDELNIDEAIDTNSVVFRQLLKSFVHDNAIDDANYYLGQALSKGKIDLDSYLKFVRQLSRQQFTQRATMIKCRQRANLPT